MRPLARALLMDADFAAVIIPDLSELVRALGETAGAVLLTEEAVRTADLARLDRWISEQRRGQICRSFCSPAQGGVDRNPTAARLSKILGNVSFPGAAVPPDHLDQRRRHRTTR